ncbi:MAG: molybdopterin-dependent oxidoreductase [Phycisphaerales bacterium]|nr:molybdopterin-dependent oxidoreductase [Phycisphaerales bacterium]
MSSARPPRDPHSTSDVSRRGFLKGAGIAAAGTVLAARSALAQSEGPPGLTRHGPGPTPIELTVNGAAQRATVDPRATLLDVLRDQLNLTGPKEVCARGSCGGCNVMLDGVVVNSCMTLALDAAGAKVKTVEGLAAGDQLDPVQSALCKHDGLQCGYCTPGFVVAIRSLLDRNPKPTAADVREACSGNICRCGTYPKVIEAALTAAGVQVAVGNVADNASVCIESEGGRLDAPQKVTGRARYTTDVNLPRMAFAQILYCPFGRATVKSADRDAAAAVPGVLEVVLNEKEFKYCGQPCGHIAAETRHALDEARLRLNVQWEIGTPVVDPVAEHQARHGPIPPELKKSGAGEKVTAALGDARHVVERVYQTQIQTHACLEPHAAVADHRGEEGEMWVSTQANIVIHGEAANAMKLDRSKVRTHCEFVGGGFGSKFGIDAEGRLAAELSRKFSRPIKVVNNRKREHLDTGCRPGSIQYMKFAAGEDGVPSAGQVHVVGVSGLGGGGDASNPDHYEFGEVARTFSDLDLSVGHSRPMRAPGKPQGMFAVDSFVDELAETAGVDPLVLRKSIDSNRTRKRMYEIGAERIGWASRPKPDGAGTGRFRRGVGVGVSNWGNGQGNASVGIHVHRDGTVKVLCGTQDIGTGVKTLLADVVADQLKIDRARITALTGSSEYPPGPPSGGSVTSRSVAPAARDAAEKARAKLAELSGMEVTDGESWIAACRKMGEESFSVVGSFNKAYWGKGGSEAVQFAEVEVDTHTGIVRVTKVVALQACGRPVNRLTAENQVIGGVIQGVSYALFEEKILDPVTGAMLNPNLEQYKILGPSDCPEIIPILWAEGDDLGVRAIGEPPVVPTAGAVANAIANAIGARVRSLPISPAKVLAALAERGGVA